MQGGGGLHYGGGASDPRTRTRPSSSVTACAAARAFIGTLPHLLVPPELEGMLFALLARRRLKRGVFEGIVELENAIRAHIKENNKAP